MITINLLPIGAFKEQYRGRLFLAVYGIFMAIAVAGLFSFKTNVMDDTLEGLRSTSSTLQAQDTRLKKQVEEAVNETKATTRQWEQLSAILELEERRRDQPRLLVEIEKLLPKTDAWLLAFAYEKGIMTLEGISRDKETVSQFLTRLEGAEYIDRQSVTLVEITQNLVINNIKLTKFKITAKTVFPKPTLLDVGIPEDHLPSRAEFIAVVEKADSKLADALKGITPAPVKKRR